MFSKDDLSNALLEFLPKVRSLITFFSHRPFKNYLHDVNLFIVSYTPTHGRESYLCAMKYNVLTNNFNFSK